MLLVMASPHLRGAGLISLCADCHGAGRIKHPEKMITGRIKLEESLEKGFHALLNEREKHVKILVRP